MLVNVKNGTSSIEVNGTSLVNHANADSILDLISGMISEGIQSKEIKILCYYQGQRRLLRQKIQGTDWADGIKDAIEIHTVDAFQGKESSVVILDMVTARDPLMFKAGRGNRAAQEQAQRRNEQPRMSWTMGQTPSLNSVQSQAT